MNEQLSKNDCKMLTRVSLKYLEKTFSATMTTKIPTGTEMELNPGLSCEKKTTNSLIRDTALCVLLIINGILKSKLQNFGVGMYNFYSLSSSYIFKYSLLLLLFIYLFICLFISFLFIDRQWWSQEKRSNNISMWNKYFRVLQYDK